MVLERSPFQSQHLMEFCRRKQKSKANLWFSRAVELLFLSRKMYPTMRCFRSRKRSENIAGYCDDFLFRNQCVSLSDAGIFRYNLGNSMIVDVLAPCVARPSTRIMVFRMDGYQLPAPTQCWEMIGNVNVFYEFNLTRVNHEGPLLPTWVYCYSSMDKKSYAQWCMWWNNELIPKLQWLHVEIWKWLSNPFIHFIMDIVDYPWRKHYWSLHLYRVSQ